MNNPIYTADQILTYLLKNGWVSISCFDSDLVKDDISQIINTNAFVNLPVTVNDDKTTEIPKPVTFIL